TSDLPHPFSVQTSDSKTSDWDSEKGRGWKSSALSRLKIAIVEPMPSAKVSAAVKANPTFLPKNRKPKRTSCTKSSSQDRLRCSRQVSLIDSIQLNWRKVDRRVASTDFPPSLREQLGVIAFLGEVCGHDSNAPKQDHWRLQTRTSTWAIQHG